MSDTRAHLLAEAQAMARISHANVIAIYEVGTYREQVFAAMELVEGTTLRKWMVERSRTWREVVDVLLLAGEGLAAAHAASVVHRDFKPENVLLGSDGRVKVSDFGLATVPSATKAHIAGTPGYLAVEAFQPGGVDERGDQFSFCVAFHEALHGSRPFSAQAFDELVAQVRRGPALEGGIRGVPARLSHAVRRGLALAPEDRYPSMRELLADIRRAITARRMRRLVAAAVGTLAFVIGATAIVVDTRATTKPPPCAGATEQLAGIWDRARRDAVKSAFLRTATPFATISFERAAAVIDRYAVDWVTARTEACEATEVRHEQSAALLELRLACVDRARIQRSGLVNVVARGTENRIYRWQSKDPDWDASHPTDGWSQPELVDAGHLVTGAPATTIQRGAMHIIARGSNNAVHHWWKDTTWHWEATGGSFRSDPDVVPFGHQLQIIGRGMDGNLYTVWYDPMTRVWTRDNHGIPIAE